MRHPRLRGQGATEGPQDRGQSAAPGQPRPYVREGRRHAQPARGSRPDPLPAQTRRRAGIGRVAPGVVGRGAERHRGTRTEGDRREPAARNHVPRRPSRRGRLREPRPAGVGRGWTQQPHQRLLLLGAARTLPLVRQRSTVSGLRQCAGDSAALVTSRGGPLLQPACTAHHRRPGERRHAHRDRSPAVEHLRESRCLAAGVLRHGRCAPPRDGTRPARRGAVRPRVHADVGRLARLPSRGSAGPGPHLRQLHRLVEGAVRAVHACVRR